MFPDARLGIVQSGQYQGRIQRLQSIQGVQSVDTSERRFRFDRQLFQGRYGRRILPLIQEPRRRVAVPAVRMLQQSHQLRRGGFAEPWRLAGLKFLRHDPVNPSLVDAALDADVLEDLRRQERGPFNQLPVHVDDLKCAIGTVG